MAFLNLRGHLGVFVSAHEIPFPGNGDFGSKRRSSNPQLLSGKTGGPRRRKVAAHQDFRSTTTTLSRRSRSSGTTTAKPDGHTRRKRRSATVFTSNEMPSLTSTRILSLQPSRHFCRSLMVVDAQCPVPRCSAGRHLPWFKRRITNRCHHGIGTMRDGLQRAARHASVRGGKSGFSIFTVTEQDRDNGDVATRLDDVAEEFVPVPVSSLWDSWRG